MKEFIGEYIISNKNKDYQLGSLDLFIVYALAFIASLWVGMTVVPKDSSFMLGFLFSFGFSYTFTVFLLFVYKKFMTAITCD